MSILRNQLFSILLFLVVSAVSFASTSVVSYTNAPTPSYQGGGWQVETPGWVLQNPHAPKGTIQNIVATYYPETGIVRIVIYIKGCTKQQLFETGKISPYKASLLPSQAWHENTDKNFVCAPQSGLFDYCPLPA